MTSVIHPAAFGRVAVLMGGDSSERDISLQSGTAVLKALKESGVDAVGVDYQGTLNPELLSGEFDRVFLMLHGSIGEDGTIQGALTMLGLPYTGSGVLASALAMDKVQAKKIWIYHGLPTPDWIELVDGTDLQAVLDRLGIVFVKPVTEGSSIGISKAENTEELLTSWQLARQYDERVIAETWIEEREYSVPIVNGQVLPVIELQADGEFYDYEAKYLSDQTRYICPAQLSDEQRIEIQALSKKAYDLLGCTGWGRVDVMRDSKGKFWLLEVNTVPGMTSHSLVPMGALEAGISFNELVMSILATTLDDGSDKS